MTTIDETAGPSTAAPFPVGATESASPPSVGADLPAGLGDDAVALARRWAHDASKAPSTGSAHLLAQVLKDESGLAFTIGFVDRVVRPEDLGVAARNLSTLAEQTPAFLPWHMRGAVRLGGLMAPVLPGVVVPVARRRGGAAHVTVSCQTLPSGKFRLTFIP